MKTVSTTHTFFSLTLATVAAGALLVGVGLGTAQAGEDRKYYPGAMCRPLSSGGQVSYGDDDSIINRSERAPLKVLCPIIRDTTDNIDGLESIRIRYYDNHRHQNIACSGHIWRGDSKFVKGRVGNKTRSMGLGEYVIDGPTYPPKDRSFSNYYTVSCSIPPKLKGKLPSKLLNYSVTEGDAD